MLHRSVDDTATGLGRDARRLSTAVRPARRRRLRAHRRAALAVDRFRRGIRSRWLASARSGSFRRTRSPARLRHRRGAGAVRRPRRPLDPLPRGADHRRLRTDARRARPRRRLAAGARRLAADRRRARRRARRPRRDGRVRPPGRLARRAATERCGAARRDAAPGDRLAGDALPSRYARTLTKYRYGPGVFKVDWALDGPIPWTNADCATGGDRPPRRNARRDRRRRARRAARPAPRAAVRAARAAEPVRPEPGAGRHAHGVGLLPRAERLDRRHDRSHRGAGRAVRPRLPRPGHRPAHDEHRRVRGARRQLRRRRHQRRRRRPPPVRRPPDDSACTRGAHRSTASTSARVRTPPGGGVHGMCGWHAAHEVLRSTR